MRSKTRVAGLRGAENAVRDRLLRLTVRRAVVFHGRSDFCHSRACNPL